MRGITSILLLIGFLAVLPVWSCSGVQNGMTMPDERNLVFGIYNQENHLVEVPLEFAQTITWLDPWISLSGKDRLHQGNPILKFEIALGANWIDMSERFFEVQAVEQGGRFNGDRLELELPGAGTYIINARATFWDGEVLYAEHTSTITILPAPEGAE